MDMYMRHRLSRFLAILNCDVETAVLYSAFIFVFRILRIGGDEVDFGEHLLHPLDDGKEVRYFGGCEFGEALHGAEGDYEDVPWQDGLYVYEGKGKRGAIEDLGEVRMGYLTG